MKCYKGINDMKNGYPKGPTVKKKKKKPAKKKTVKRSSGY